MTAKKELISEAQIQQLIEKSVIKAKPLASLIMKALKLDDINEVYNKSGDTKGVDFADTILDTLKINYQCSDEELKNIPLDEPFIAVANHPYGGIDGLILLSIFGKQRPDFKIMTNFLLSQIKELSEHFVSVDPFETRKGMSITGIKRSLKLIEDGHPIGIFPAGEVSSFKFNSMKISDKMWSTVVGKMIMKSNVKVVPVYFSGKNSLMFNILGIIHPRLRTARLPGELLNKQNEKIVVRIGKPISTKKLKEFDEADQLLRFVRAKTYALESSLDVGNYFKFRIAPRIQTPEPIISETPTESMLADLQRIASKALLFKQDKLGVYIASARFIPNILREISRQREITFRAVGEGTNQSCDTDEYDIHYKHLFIWDHEANKLVGAYRIGLGDVLYRRYKKKGFYLNELFKISKDFSPILKNSLELGRSFIVEAYQRKPLSLMLLWKGVNEYLKRENYRYRYLIGPVSISNSFSGLSKDLLVDFIRKYHFDEELAMLVKPRKKYSYQYKGEGKALRNMDVNDMKILDGLIGDIETNQMKVPVLLKKYLKQNAKIIAFNIDPKFNNALDGFLVMDLQNVPKDTFEMVN
jgi:putative hemolysin